MNDLAGTVRLPKETLNYDFLNRDPANRKSAFLDLWAWANDRARELTVGTGRTIKLERGQLAHSMLTLSKAWRWNHEKVKSFLVQLQDEGLITFEATNTTTVITLIDYTVYNPDSTPEPLTNREPNHEPNIAPNPTPNRTPTANQIATEGGSGKIEVGRGKGTPAAADCEIPNESEVAAFCAGYLDLSRGITSGIPEIWWLGWLKEALSKRHFPANWKQVLTLAFRADWLGHHPKARPVCGTGGFVGEKNGAATETLPQRRMRLTLELRDVTAARESEHQSGAEPDEKLRGRQLALERELVALDGRND